MNEDNRKNELVRAMMNIEYHPTFINEEKDLNTYIKLPMAEIAALGGALATLPISFRTVTQTITSSSGEGIYKAIFPNGVVGELAKAKDGSGYLGTIMNDGIVGQTRWIPVEGTKSTVATTIPYNPTMLFMAVALMDIENKLSNIQETQQEILEFMEEDKKSQLIGNIETLADIMNNYKYNWDNEKYKTNQHIQVLEIKKHAKQNIDFYRCQIEKTIDKKSILHSDRDIEIKVKRTQKGFKNYQLALYIYSFASFMEVMLLENFDSEYLKSIITGLEDYSYQYRVLYTKCYDQIESEAGSTLSKHLLNGVAGISQFAGDTIAKIPVVSRGFADESLIAASERIGKFSDIKSGKATDRIRSSRYEVVSSFVDRIKTVDQLYNQPMELLFDAENLYLKSY